MNFGNACGGFYTTSGGQMTQLLASCPGIEADIKACQANGKKILLSLGGGSATGAYIASETSAVAFADFLWGAFGPQTDEWTAAGNPRPFGDAVVDGFDFDIESLAADIPTTIDFGYAAMANEFRRLFGLSTSSQTFYLSAAPQCIVPDGHLADAISKAVFDFM
jgi:chitinase